MVATLRKQGTKTHLATCNSSLDLVFYRTITTETSFRLRRQFRLARMQERCVESRLLSKLKTFSKEEIFLVSAKKGNKGSFFYFLSRTLHHMTASCLKITLELHLKVKITTSHRAIFRAACATIYIHVF